MPHPPSTPWLTFPRPNPEAPLRLYCFPYAGGAASLYRSWSERLPALVELCPVQLPGREGRLAETPFTELPALVDRLADILVPRLADRSLFAFFGHSMGALISFELARALRRRGVVEPAHLFLSARGAPHLERARRAIHQLPEEAFREELRRLNGTPEAVLQEPELMALMMPLLRADFALVERYRYVEEPPLSCPISVFGGVGDVEVTLEALEGWRYHTTGPFRLHRLPGDHFFVQKAPRPLWERLAVACLALIEQRQGSRSR